MRLFKQRKIIWWEVLKETLNLSSPKVQNQHLKHLTQTIHEKLKSSSARETWKLQKCSLLIKNCQTWNLLSLLTQSQNSHHIDRSSITRDWWTTSERRTFKQKFGRIKRTFRKGKSVLFFQKLITLWPCEPMNDFIRTWWNTRCEKWRKLHCNKRRKIIEK